VINKRGEDYIRQAYIYLINQEELHRKDLISKKILNFGLSPSGVSLALILA
jgi:hypothetical protein